MDVNGAPVGGALVQAGEEGGTWLKATPLKESGLYEVLLPANTHKFVVHVEAKSFWPIDQKLLLNTEPQPTLSFDGEQAVNVLNVNSYTRGNDYNVEIRVMPGQLRDATERVAALAKEKKIDLGLKKQLVDTFTLKLMNPQGEGPSFNRTTKEAEPEGMLFFAEHMAVPRLYAIYRPSGIATHPDPESAPTVPLKYHIFFHPFIVGNSGKDYPFDQPSIDLVWRYMLAPFSDAEGNNNPYWKQMIHQHEATEAGKNVIFIFPIGSPTAQMGKLNSQKAALRLLREVNYWIQRMDGVPYPLQPVGRLALSSFSGGTYFLRAVFRADGSGTLDNYLREVYLLDPVLATPDKVTGEADTRGLQKAVLTWWDNGKDGKILRVYTQDAGWFATLSAASGGEPVDGPENGREIAKESCSIVFCPADHVFTPRSPLLDFWIIHQFVPAVFLAHAVGNSSF